jgi:hypothetical protein
MWAENKIFKNTIYMGYKMGKKQTIYIQTIEKKKEKKLIKSF